MADNTSSTDAVAMTHEGVVEKASEIARLVTTWQGFDAQFAAFADLHRNHACPDCGKSLSGIIDSIVDAAKDAQKMEYSLSDFADRCDISLLSSRASSELRAIVTMLLRRYSKSNGGDQVQ